MMEIITNADWDFPGYEIHADGRTFFALSREDGTWHVFEQSSWRKCPENIISVSQAIAFIEGVLIPAGKE